MKTQISELTPTDSDSLGSGSDPRVCVSNRFPGETLVMVLAPTLNTPDCTMQPVNSWKPKGLDFQPDTVYFSSVPTYYEFILTSKLTKQR